VGFGVRACHKIAQTLGLTGASGTLGLEAGHQDPRAEAGPFGPGRRKNSGSQRKFEGLPMSQQNAGLCHGDLVEVRRRNENLPDAGPSGRIG